MLLSEVYKDKIVHIIGAPTEYIGEIDNHPMCKKDFNGWLRIKNPCFIGQMQRKENNKPMIKTHIVKMGMPTGDYKEHIDMFIPDFAIEIRPLDKEGGLYAAYQNQREKSFKRSALIYTPETDEIMRFKQGNKEKLRRVNQGKH